MLRRRFWTFAKHSFTVDFLRSVVVGHDSIPGEGSARTLASTLSCTSDCFRSGSQPGAGVEFHPVSFAISNRIHLLGQSKLVGTAPAFFLALHSNQCCVALAGTRSSSTAVCVRQSTWDRHLFCCRIYPFSLRWGILHPTEQVRYLRFFSRVEFLCADHQFLPLHGLAVYLPLLMLLVAVAVLPVTRAAENLVLPKRTIASLTIFVLFAAACLGYPSRPGDPRQKADRLQSWEALHFSTRPRRSAEFIAQRHFIESAGQAGGIVFSDISPIYLNALFPPGFVAAPLDGKRYIQFRHIVHYDHAEAIALAELSLRRSIPVYALFVSSKELDEKASRLPNIPGYQWMPAENTRGEAVILRLTSAQ